MYVPKTENYTYVLLRKGTPEKPGIVTYTTY